MPRPNSISSLPTVLTAPARAIALATAAIGKRAVSNRWRFSVFPLTLFGLAAVLIAVGGGAFAAASSTADSTGVIHGCVSNHPSRGVHRIEIRDSSVNCPKHTTGLDWNQQGPQGPAGPQGPSGPQGSPGQQGPAGSFTGKFTSPNGIFSISVTDSGIMLTGPTSRILIGTAGITIDDSAAVRVKAPVIELNGCSIGPPSGISCP